MTRSTQEQFSLRKLAALTTPSASKAGGSGEGRKKTSWTLEKAPPAWGPPAGTNSRPPPEGPGQGSAVEAVARSWHRRERPPGIGGRVVFLVLLEGSVGGSALGPSPPMTWIRPPTTPTRAPASRRHGSAGGPSIRGWVELLIGREHAVDAAGASGDGVELSGGAWAVRWVREVGRFGSRVQVRAGRIEDLEGRTGAGRPLTAGHVDLCSDRGGSRGSPRYAHSANARPSVGPRVVLEGFAESGAETEPPSHRRAFRSRQRTLQWSPATGIGAPSLHVSMNGS